jgi:hypothetical protein
MRKLSDSIESISKVRENLKRSVFMRVRSMFKIERRRKDRLRGLGLLELTRSVNR